MISIEAKNWKLRQYMEFNQAVKDSDFMKILQLLALIVTTWPYEGDPSDVNYWLDNLDVPQWVSLMNGVSEQLKAAFTSPKA